MVFEKQIDFIKSDFEKSRRLLLAIGDETRQSIIITLMGACDGETNQLPEKIENMSKTIAVTGGTGYIAGFVIAEFKPRLHGQGKRTQLIKNLP